MRRLLAIALCLSFASRALQPGGSAHAEPQPCAALITVPKPRPVPFPNPKPAPLPSGGIAGTVGGNSLGAWSGIEVDLYRCQESAGTQVASTQTDAEGHFAFVGLDAAFDYYVEAALPPASLLGAVYRTGAYAVPGMTDIAITRPE
jgi:hypothetical protein